MSTRTSEQSPCVGQCWRHAKRQSVYVVMGSGELQDGSSEHDGAGCVIYKDSTTGSVYARPVAEFVDGRFELMDKVEE